MPKDQGLDAYRATYRRHRWLYLLIPLVVAVLVLFMGLSSKSYKSNASLWVDSGASSSSSLNVSSANAAPVLPSTVEQTTLNELLSTTAFDQAVARSAGVPAADVRAKAAALPLAVTSTVPGPQVLQLTYAGTSLADAQSITTALIKQLQLWTDRFEQHFSSAAARYDQTLYNSDAQAVANAKAALASYRSSHPGSNNQNDPTYANLTASLTTASNSLASAKTTLDQALAQTRDNGSSATVSVINGASTPISAVSKKKLLIKAFGGALGGAAISVLLIILFTRRDRRKWAAVVEDPAVMNSPTAVAAIEPPAALRSETAAISSSQSWTTGGPRRASIALVSQSTRSSDSDPDGDPVADAGRTSAVDGVAAVERDSAAERESPVEIAAAEIAELDVAEVEIAEVEIVDESEIEPAQSSVRAGAARNGAHKLPPPNRARANTARNGARKLPPPKRARTTAAQNRARADDDADLQKGA